jgi:hypothetical protein
VIVPENPPPCYRTVLPTSEMNRDNRYKTPLHDMS